MAVTQFSKKNQQTYIGLAGDTKPTTGANPGDLFLTTDTLALFIYTGTAWVQIQTTVTPFVGP